MQIPLTTFLTDVYSPARMNLGPQTEVKMLQALKRLDFSRSRTTYVSELSEGLVLGHMKWLVQNEYSPRQVNIRRGYLLALWNLAYRKKYVEEDPRRADVEPLREPKVKPIAWSIDQIEAMLTRCAVMKPRGKCQFGGREWMALILLLYYTGLRIMAVLRLERSALKGHYLYVPYSIQKDFEETLIRLPDHLVNLLHSLRRPRIEKDGRVIGEMLIPWPWGYRNVQDIFWRNILKPAGLPKDHRLKFHAFRKTCGTLVAHHAGKEAAKNILGHSDMKTTERYLAEASLIQPGLPGALSPMDVLPRLGNVS